MSDMEDTFKQPIIDPEMDEQLLKYFVSHIHEHWVLLKELHSTFSETKAYGQNVCSSREYFERSYAHVMATWSVWFLLTSQTMKLS